MGLKEEFESAVNRVQELSQRPGNLDLLKLYAFYKQATEGDVSGKRPGMLDVKGRAKFDAWEKVKGQNAAESQQLYIDLVNRLSGEDQ